MGWKVTWKQDRNAWTDYAREGNPMEDFAETAAHMIAGTSIARENTGSGRYKFMLDLLPGFGNPAPKRTNSKQEIKLTCDGYSSFWSA